MRRQMLIGSLVLKVHWNGKAANILVYACLGELRHQGAFVSLSIPSMKGVQGAVREEGLDLEMSCLVWKTISNEKTQPHN